MNDNNSCIKSWPLLLGTLLAASSSACSADELPLRNVGNTSEGQALTAPVTNTPVTNTPVTIIPVPNAPVPNAPVTNTPVLSGNASFEGRWLGQTEEPLVPDAEGAALSYAFPSGSRQVVLELTRQGDELTGSITFGSGVVPEPEAGLAYPPGVNYGLGGLVPNINPLEGLAYGLTDVSAEHSPGVADEAVLTYARFAGFTDWCPLQPPVPLEGGGHACVGGSGSGGGVTADGSRQCTLFQSDGSPQPIDCDYLSLCTGIGPCVCAAEGCVADEATANFVYLQLIGGELRATFPDTIVHVSDRLGDIRLQRAPD